MTAIAGPSLTSFAGDVCRGRDSEMCPQYIKARIRRMLQESRIGAPFSQFLPQRSPAMTILHAPILNPSWSLLRFILWNIWGCGEGHPHLKKYKETKIGYLFCFLCCKPAMDLMNKEPLIYSWEPLKNVQCIQGWINIGFRVRIERLLLSCLTPMYSLETHV